MQTSVTISELMLLMGVDLPPEIQAKLQSLSNGKDVTSLAKEAAQKKASEEAAKTEAVYTAIEKAVADTLAGYPEYRIPANGLRLSNEGKVLRPMARASTGGNGEGKRFGGGGSVKVRGPFIDLDTGAEYADWHAAAKANGHECTQDKGSAGCGYWAVVVKLKEKGRVIPKASYTPPPTPEPVADAPAITEEVMESLPALTLAEQLTQEPAPTPEKKGKKGKK